MAGPHPAPPGRPRRLLLVGFAVTNQAAAAALLRHGHDVVVCDDRPTAALHAAADHLGLELVPAPTPERLAELVAQVEAVLPTPGLPDAHPALAAAARAGVGVVSELDLAGWWDQRPVLAITGTNGKTTVTTLVTEMLRASGRVAVAAGNTEVPLVAAIDDPTTEVFVVEASSFRLGHSRRFAPRVGTWLNFGPDHLDVHRSLGAYEAAKASIWRHQGAADLAVANADDPVVMRHAARLVGPRLETFSIAPSAPFGPSATHRVEGGRVLAGEEPVIAVDELWSPMPHDRANALAATATALGGGAHVAGVAHVLGTFRGLPHRVQLVAERAGVRWYDDSKATAPHATVSALRGFPPGSVVLLAGGRNKGLDLTELAVASGHLAAVVGFGEAGPDVRAALAAVPGSVVVGVPEAVEEAARLARPGQVVLLSPACASFDAYGSYAERGRHFTDCVGELLGGPGSVGEGR